MASCTGFGVAAARGAGEKADCAADGLKHIRAPQAADAVELRWQAARGLPPAANCLAWAKVDMPPVKQTAAANTKPVIVRIPISHPTNAATCQPPCKSRPSARRARLTMR